MRHNRSSRNYWDCNNRNRGNREKQGKTRSHRQIIVIAIISLISFYELFLTATTTLHLFLMYFVHLYYKKKHAKDINLMPGCKISDFYM